MFTCRSANRKKIRWRGAEVVEARSIGTFDWRRGSLLAKRYYDFNIRNYPQFVEKLRYIHRNPVKAGLCERPEDWEWSSFRHYATGCEGRVEIESEWTARKRERAAGRLLSRGRTAPLKPKSGLSGPPVGYLISHQSITGIAFFIRRSVANFAKSQSFAYSSLLLAVT
jgi:hypothetical protein